MSKPAARGLFVTGTGTGVGKTILSAVLVAGMVSAGESVRAYKPIVTGLEDPPGRWPADHELLGSLSGMSPELVAPVRFGPAVSPHLAAELTGEKVDPAGLLETARGALKAAGEAGEILVVEGVGGLLVPLAEGLSVCELAAELGLPVLIAAHPGLGTINHTLLTLRVARAEGLWVPAVVFGPQEAEHPQRKPPPVEDPRSERHARVAGSYQERLERLRAGMESSNRETIEHLGEVEVAQLAYVDGPDRAALARAAGALAWREWLQGPGAPVVVPTMGQ